jgi:hypothetical protein
MRVKLVVEIKISEKRKLKENAKNMMEEGD